MNLLCDFLLYFLKYIAISGQVRTCKLDIYSIILLTVAMNNLGIFTELDGRLSHTMLRTRFQANQYQLKGQHFSDRTEGASPTRKISSRDEGTIGEKNE